MTRDYRIEYVPVPTKTTTTIYHCDKCDKHLNDEGEEDQFPNELIIFLNIDQCVSHRFRKDLCTECLEPIWLAMCKALGVDSDDISGSDFDGEY